MEKIIKKSNSADISLGIILIGLGIVFLIKPFSLFPWILLIISLIYLKDIFLRKNIRKSLSAFLWLFGLFIIFLFDVFFAGILILIGLQVLISSIFNKN